VLCPRPQCGSLRKGPSQGRSASGVHLTRSASQLFAVAGTPIARGFGHSLPLTLVPHSQGAPAVLRGVRFLGPHGVGSEMGASVGVTKTHESTYDKSLPTSSRRVPPLLWPYPFGVRCPEAEGRTHARGGELLSDPCSPLGDALALATPSWGALLSLCSHRHRHSVRL